MKTTMTTLQISANVFGAGQATRFDGTASFDGIPVEVEYETQEADGTPGSRPFYQITAVHSKYAQVLNGSVCDIVIHKGADVQDLIGRAAVEALEERLQNHLKEAS